MKILLANDDGISSPGLRALYFALKAERHEVEAVAPMEQQSGVSRSLTVFYPLRAREVSDCDFRGMAISGHPADCVKLALGELLPWKPDLVISGINNGPNTGVEVFYSGTVGAASEACHTGIPTLALSHAGRDGCGEWDNVARHAATLVKAIQWDQIPSRRVISVNYPNRLLADCAGVRICPLTTVIWENSFAHERDPFGDGFWWIRGLINESAVAIDSDRDLINRGYITITPLMFDLTDREGLDLLKNMGLES